MKFLQIALLTTLFAMPARSETIRWFSVAESANLASSGGAMDGEFNFELGVFKDGFVPFGDGPGRMSGLFVQQPTRIRMMPWFPLSSSLVLP